MIDSTVSSSQGMARPAPTRSDAVAPQVTQTQVEEPARAVAAVQEPGSATSPTEDLTELLEGLSQRLNEFVQNNARELEFRVNDEGGQVVILVRQSSTGEVLRTIPPEEATALVDNLSDGAAALFSQLA